MRHPQVLAHGRRARLEDFEARFVASGIPWLEPRFLGLVRRAGGTAHGAVVELAESEWQTIAAHEEGYTLEAVQLAEPVLQATALVLHPQSARPEGTPSQRYAALLVEGAAHFELPVLPHYEEAYRRGARVTRWVAGPIGLLRDHAPWLGPGGVILAVATPPLLVLIAVTALALWLT